MFCVFCRQREVKMLSSAGSRWLMIYWAVLMILCRDVLSAAEHLPYHQDAVCEDTLNGAAVGRLQGPLRHVHLPERSKKVQPVFCLLDQRCGFCCPRKVLWNVWAMNLKLDILSQLMCSGKWTSCFFLKSIMSYFVFLMKRVLLCRQTHRLWWSAPPRSCRLWI